MEWSRIRRGAREFREDRRRGKQNAVACPGRASATLNLSPDHSADSALQISYSVIGVAGGIGGAFLALGFVGHFDSVAVGESEGE
jgi:hypothetical protein